MSGLVQSLQNLIKTDKLFGLKMDTKDTLIKCRTIPFFCFPQQQTNNYSWAVDFSYLPACYDKQLGIRTCSLG